MITGLAGMIMRGKYYFYKGAWQVCSKPGTPFKSSQTAV